MPNNLLTYDAVLHWGLNPGPPALETSTLSLGYRGGNTTICSISYIDPIAYLLKQTNTVLFANCPSTFCARELSSQAACVFSIEILFHILIDWFQIHALFAHSTIDKSCLNLQNNDIFVRFYTLLWIVDALLLVLAQSV